MSCTSKNLTEGYINPGSKDTTIWVNDQMYGYTPIRTVEVVLSTGETVEAEIPELMKIFCVRYRDYPPAKDKRVLVYLEKNKEGGYWISWGDVEGGIEE